MTTPSVTTMSAVMTAVVPVMATVAVAVTILAVSVAGTRFASAARFLNHRRFGDIRLSNRLDCGTLFTNRLFTFDVHPEAVVVAAVMTVVAVMAMATMAVSPVAAVATMTAATLGGSRRGAHHQGDRNK
jgi:hypothetical protein